MRSFFYVFICFLSLNAWGYTQNATECPAPDALNHYIDVPVFPKLEQIAEIKNIPGLKLHRDLRPRYENKKIRIYFELLKPYDAHQDILFLFAGGPGESHVILHEFIRNPADNYFAKNFNVVAMDQRGRGCSRPVFPDDLPIQSYLTRYAASDAEAIRTALGGANATIDVFGGSYGSVSALTYALLFPKHLKNLFLEAVSSSYKDGILADANYEHLVLDWDSKLRAQFESLKRISPSLANDFLNWSISPMFSYFGRTKDVPEKLHEILLEAQKGEFDKAKKSLYRHPWVMTPMMRAVACQELDTPPPPDGKFHMYSKQRQACKEFDGLYDYIDYSNDMNKITARTFLWSGAFDLHSPQSNVDKIAAKIPNNFYFRDPYLGHYPGEKRICYNNMLQAFFAGASNAQLRSVANSKECIELPVNPLHSK